MPNITWCDLPEDVSLWPGLPLSLSGDEVMPLDYHAGRSGWLLYGRGLDKQRLSQYQSKLGAAMVIVAAWCVEDYQVIRLAGWIRDYNSTKNDVYVDANTSSASKRNWMSRRWGKSRTCARRVCW